MTKHFATEDDFITYVLNAKLPVKSYKNHVYFAQETDGECLIKIGYSSNIRRRVRDLGYERRQKVILLGTKPGRRSAERKIQERFAAYRKFGEWFYPVPELVIWIQKNMEFVEQLPLPFRAEA